MLVSSATGRCSAMVNDPDIFSVHVLISGLVQGVGYRVWVAAEAKRLGLSGWARNLHTGEVEAVFSGPMEVVDAMLAACRRGPPLAQVAAVDIIAEAEPLSGPFAVRHDG
jgi:acylphosphatase